MKIAQLISKFFKVWNELIVGPLAVLLWVFSNDIIHWIDPTAATFDVAVFQKIIFAIAAFCTFSFCGWLLMRIQFPKRFRFIAEEFDDNVSQLTPFQQCVISLCVLAFYVLALALCGLIL